LIPYGRSRIYVPFVGSTVWPGLSPSDASLVIPVTPGSEPIVDFRREISRGWITKLVLQRDSAGS
jgi:hypothetical protein